ncbi:MAG TPA: copper resistance protein CopC [Thermoplasmata archaeon]|nr:copper resistance protein CopC [Thermoplasmata archaeon]
MNPRVAFGIVAFLLIAGMGSGVTTAHANYVSSTPGAGAILPTAPIRVNVTLTEAVQPDSPSIRVTNSSGVRFDVPPVTISADRVTISTALNASAPGLYTVTWTAISAVDGHFTAGSFAYGVQDANGSLPGFPSQEATSTGSPVSLAEVAFKFIGFLGLSIALGTAVLCVFMWLPAGRDPDVRVTRAYGLGFQVLLNLARSGAFVFGVSMVGLWLLATSFEGASAIAGLRNSTYVQSLAVRMAIALGLFAVLARSFALSRTETPETTMRSLRLALVLGVAAIVGSSFGTHAAADLNLAAVGVAADAAHLTGVGLWVGGLAGIVTVRSFLRDEDALPLARIVLGRFSRLAAYAVGLVLAGGLVLTLLLVRTWDGLLGFPYGWVVLGKIVLFIPMVFIGAYNRYWLIPSTSGTEQPEFQETAIGAMLAGFFLGLIGVWVFVSFGGNTNAGLIGALSLFAGVLVIVAAAAALALTKWRPRATEPAAAVRHLASNVRFETVIGVAVLALAGLLTSMSPLTAVVSGPQQTLFSVDQTKDGLRIQFEIEPYPTVPQVYTFTFLVWNASDNKAYAGILNGTIVFNRTNSVDPPIIEKLDGPHLNHLFRTSPALSKAGVWQVQGRFHRVAGFDVWATFYVTIRAA